MYLNRISTSFLWQICLLGTIMVGCSVNKARQDDQLKPFFDQQQATGSFTMLDNATGEVTVYNLQADTTRYAPGSTLDVLTALIGLETGVIPDESAAVPTADSLTKLSIRDAFVQSNHSSFQWMANQIGSDVLQTWIDSLGYGNKQLGSITDSSWPNSTMRISPDEQLGLMKRLYFDQLPFRKSVQENMRDWMKQEDNSAYRLHGRMAAVSGAKTSTGWYIGWIEENRHVYFFVTLVNKNGVVDNMQTVAQQITRSVLQHYGFFQGKK